MGVWSFGVPEEISCVCFLVNSLLRFWWWWCCIGPCQVGERILGRAWSTNQEMISIWTTGFLIIPSGTSQAPWRPGASPPLQELGWLACVGVLCVVCCPRRRLPSDLTGSAWGFYNVFSGYPINPWVAKGRQRTL